jgi:hypothetical protein
LTSQKDSRLRYSKPLNPKPQILYLSLLGRIYASVLANQGCQKSTIQIPKIQKQTLTEDAPPLQAISNLANAYSKAGMTDDDALMSHLASAALCLPPEAFSPQSVANIANAYSKLNPKEGTRGMTVTLLRHMSRSAQCLSPASLDMQNIANIVNAYAKVAIRDVPLITSMISAVSNMSSSIASVVGGGLLTADPQAIANILHALAVLDIREGLTRPVVDCITQPLIQVPPEECQAQGVANLAWACAVLRITDDELMSWLMDALRSHLPGMNWTCLRQVQQFLLTMELDCRGGLGESQDTRLEALLGSARGGAWGKEEPAGWRHDGWLGITRMLAWSLDIRAAETLAAEGEPEAAEGCDAVAEMVSREASPSRLQMEVARHLEMLDLDISEEVLHERTGYSVDIAVNLPGGKRVLVEVDGPFHYACGTRTRLGSSRMKLR